MARRRNSEWLSLLGEWALAIWTFTIGLLFVALFPGWLAVFLAQWTFRRGNLALEIAVATVLMMATAFSVWLAFTERRMPSTRWSERAAVFLSRVFGPRFSEGLSINRTGATIRTVMVAFFAVASFASLTSLLILEGAVTISEPVSQDDVIFEAATVYVWHLLDTVPLLDIPQNLEWELPFEFEDSLGGLLLIFFTAIVILPLIRVARAIWTGNREPYEEALLASIRSRKDWRVAKLPGKVGYERAVVVRTVEESSAEEDEEPKDERILVDVIRDVSTEDAALNRLDFLRGELADASDIGYLLVVNAVAARARDRIESAFAQSELPAALAVWRSDQPAADLTRAVEALFERIDSARQP